MIRFLGDEGEECVVVLYLTSHREYQYLLEEEITRPEKSDYDLATCVDHPPPCEDCSRRLECLGVETCFYETKEGCGLFTILTCQEAVFGAAYPFPV